MDLEQNLAYVSIGNWFFSVQPWHFLGLAYVLGWGIAARRACKNLIGMGAAALGGKSVAKVAAIKGLAWPLSLAFAIFELALSYGAVPKPADNVGNGHPHAVGARSGHGINNLLGPDRFTLGGKKCRLAADQPCCICCANVIMDNGEQHNVSRTDLKLDMAV